MAKGILILMGKIHLQSQEYEKTSKKIKLKKTIPKCIIIKLPKTRENREKDALLTGKVIKIIDDFSFEQSNPDSIF